VGAVAVAVAVAAVAAADSDDVVRKQMAACTAPAFGPKQPADAEGLEDTAVDCRLGYLTAASIELLSELRTY
jgi:hypothetical protein